MELVEQMKIRRRQQREGQVVVHLAERTPCHVQGSGFRFQVLMCKGEVSQAVKPVSVSLPPPPITVSFCLYPINE